MLQKFKLRPTKVRPERCVLEGNVIAHVHRHVHKKVKNEMERGTSVARKPRRVQGGRDTGGERLEGTKGGGRKLRNSRQHCVILRIKKYHKEGGNHRGRGWDWE